MNENKLREESHWEVVKDEETGEKYWSGGCNGDMDRSDFDPGEALKLDPKHFAVGFVVKGYEPVTRENCCCPDCRKDEPCPACDDFGHQV